MTATPAAVDATGHVTCGLCGHRFAPAAARAVAACAACPLPGRCDLVCCPRCGYRFVGESRLINLVRRLLRR